MQKHERSHERAAFQEVATETCELRANQASEIVQKEQRHQQEQQQSTESDIDNKSDRGPSPAADPTAPTIMPVMDAFLSAAKLKSL